MFLQFSSDMSRSQMKSEIIVEIEFLSGIKHETVLQVVAVTYHLLVKKVCAF